MESMPRVSETLNEMARRMRAARDNEVACLAEVLPQYITDHNDSAAFRACDRQVAKFARAIDKMIARLEKWETEAEAIEESVDCFYGE